MVECQVAYTTDGSNSLVGYSIIDENGKSGLICQNGGVHYLGWYKNLASSEKDDNNWCDQNNYHYVRVEQVY